MKKWLFLFCICGIYLNAVPFYQNPSPENAYTWLEKQKIEQATENDRPYVLSLAATFIAQILKVHPDYIERFAQDFSHFSPLQKSIFQQAFSSAQIKDARIQEDETSSTMPIFKLDHLEFKSGHDFDLMVTSYLATGNENFLSQPMAFLNSDPELLFFTYEWHNRQFLTQFLKEVTGRSELPDEAEFSDQLKSWTENKLQQFILTMAAWHCLDLIKREDPTAAQKISKLCQDNPKIDYQGTLAKLLK